MILYDARGNEYQGSLDAIAGQTFTDARVLFATLSSLNAAATSELNGHNTVNFDLRSAAMNATLSFEYTMDNTNWYSLPVKDQQTELFSLTTVITTTIAKTFTANTAGMRAVRVRVSAYTSGSVVAVNRGSIGVETIFNKPVPTTLWVTVTAAANTGATVTLPAAGAGLYHYITSINIMRNATAALAGAATLVITSTNLPGSPAWSVGNAMAAGGTQTDLSQEFPNPIKSSVANTATTIVMPVPGAAVLWRGNVSYYVGA